MTRLKYFLLLLIFGASCQSDKNVKTNLQPTVPPNILFILVDDLGYADLSVMGSTYYETPNIDGLAKAGSIFTDGYATCSVCSPSRASLLTGQFPARHGITNWIGAKSGVEWKNLNRYTKLLPPEYNHHLSHEDTVLPEAFKEQGYATFFAGKWHLGSEELQSLPTDHGFDINQGGYERGGPYSGGFFSPFNNPYMADHDHEKGMSLPMKLANETSTFIAQSNDQPFLAYLSFYAVHAPIQTTKNKWEKYRNKAEGMGIHENGFEMERVLPARKYQDNPVYAGLIEHVDEAVGKVLQTLKEQNLQENTIVVFTSDNGGVTSGDNFSTNLLQLRGGKGYQWEGGTRVPFFIYVPWSNTPKKIDVPVSGADLYPTLLDLAGIPTKDDQHLDGKSLVPLLEGSRIAERPLFWHYPHYGNQGGEPSSIIREGRWKLIYYWEDLKSELYDLSSDLSERRDIKDEHPLIAEKMTTTLLNWLEETQAHYGEVDESWDEEARAKRLNDHKNVLLPRLETQRREMLDPNWQPNDDWWGSKVD